MSKKPLVRSKKRAVHTNTKDKLSKLIVEVNSIAKELSKVKKGGIGYGIASAINLVYGSKKQNFFTKIGDILNKNKETIMNIKYEFIDLLIDSHIKSSNNNYVVTYNEENKTLEISDEITKLITNLISTHEGKGIFDYDELKVDNIKLIQRNGEDNIVNMKKIAHILNIIRYLYQEVNEDSRDINDTTSFDKKTHYTDSKINQILFDQQNNNRDFRYQYMNILKNKLMEKIFEYVSKISTSLGGQQEDLIKSIKKLYESINKKNIFEYLPKLEIIHNLQSLGNSNNANDIYNDINLLNRIKFKYDIYTKIICPESTKNLFIHEESKNNPFLFDDIYKDILEDSNIIDIITLKEGIKLHKINTTIKENDSQRKKSSYMIDKLTATNNIKNAFTKGEFSKLFAKGNKRDPLNDIIINQKSLSLKIRSKIDEIRDIEISKNDEEISLNTITNKHDRKIKQDKIHKLNINITALKKELNALNNENEANIERLDIIKKELIKNYIADNKSTEKEAQEIFQSYIDSYESQQAAEGGKLVAKYKSTGESVYILYKKKKIKRCVYEKTKGRGKYCKIDGEYKLLSKLKIM